MGVASNPLATTAGADRDADRKRDAQWNALAEERKLEADADLALVVSGPEAVARIRASLG